MSVVYSNNASTSLSSGITNSETSITVGSVAGLPSLSAGDYYFATLANVTNTKIEIIKVTAAAGTTLTVVRGQDDTTAVSFDAGDNLQLRVTAATLDAATRTDVKITGGSIAGAAISNDVIDSQHYVDGSIDTAHIANDAVTGDKLADSSIDTIHLTADAVTAGKLANSINNAIAANTAKTTNATHTGEVTGATALTIADNIVDEANLKVSNAPTNGYFLSAQSGDTGGLTWAEVDTTLVVAALTAGTNVAISAGGVISSTDTNTTYSVGDGGLTQKNFTTTLKNKLDGVATSANNYSHPTYNGDDFSIDTGHLSGATVIDDIDINVTTDSQGHVTDCNGTVATRNLTLADLGYTGATNANYITNNNQLTNGAGYVTTDTNTTYSADGNYGITLSGTTFRLENDRRRNSTGEDVYSGNTHDYTFYDASHGIRWYTSGSEEMRLENDGDLHVDGNVVAHSTTVSDRRLKDNIQPIEDALSKVNQLNGCTFTYTSDDKESAGLIAQDIEKVLPSAVSEMELPLKKDDGNKYKTVQYDQVIGLLVESIKELSDKVSKLENNKEGI